jgi:tetratricopeptide (TPR) repeat protein
LIAQELGVNMTAENLVQTSQMIRWKSIFFRGVFCLVLSACLVRVVRDGAGAWFAREGTAEGIRRAAKWDSANPEYPAQLAHLAASEMASADPREMVTDLEHATRLGPQRAIHWANLGEAYELNQKIPDAASAYGRAVGLLPKSPQINWQFANFLIRTGNVRDAVAPLREAILGDPGLRTGAFDIAWRAGIPPPQVLDMVPDRQDILSAYLDYLVQTQRLDAAPDAWRRLLASTEAFDMDAAFRYFDALLLARRVDQMLAVWSDLARHDPARIPWQPDAANLIFDGGFEAPIPNGGFGWRNSPIEGAAVSFDSRHAHGGTRSLVVRFDGKHNLDFANIVQFVSVAPLTSYRFLAYARTEGITTDSGPRIAIYDPLDREALSLETENLLGTSGWTEQELAFHTGANTRLIVVQIVRPPSRKLDNLIAGTLWLDDFSLIANP